MECAFVLMVLFFSVVLRWSVSLNGYSGAGKPPMFGDYEAQRHWMEITYNLPINEWYHNSTENDLLYWGLDYPPLTAYHSWLCGAIAAKINTSWIELYTSRGLEDPIHKLFMRYTVLVSDIIYACAIFAYCFSLSCITLQRNKILTAGLILSFPGLIIIDHGHFQYNSVSLGLMVLGFVLISTQHQILGASSFCLSLSFKQMELYHSLPFFSYLLAWCFAEMEVIKGFIKLCKIGLTVILTFALVWGPFLVDKSQILQVLHRVFPFERGLYEDKVANVWCSLSILIKLKEMFTVQQMLKICMTTTVLGLLPSSIHLFFRPTPHTFKVALINSSLVFFLFSFQVHEKSVLLPAIPVCLLLPEKPLPALWFLIISTFSMLPLLIKDGLVTAYIASSALFFLLVVLAWQYVFTTNMSANAPQSVTELRAQREKRDRNETYDAVIGVFFWLSLLGAALLTVVTLLMKPPARLPDLWAVMISAYSCGHFLLFLVYFHYLQFSYGEETQETKVVKVKLKERGKGKGRTFGNKKKVQ